MHAKHGRRVEKIGGEITVGDGVEAVLGNRAETERAGERGAVHWKRAAGERARAERQGGGPFAGLCQPLPIPRQRPEVPERPVTPADGLCRLQVGVARHGRV